MSFSQDFKEKIVERIFGKPVTFRKSKSRVEPDDEGVVKRVKKPVKRVAKKKK